MSQELHDLVAPYALDALEDEERERFERHLAECEECAAQLEMLQGTTAALAYAAEGPAPPAALRERIVESAHSEPRAAVIRLPRRRWAFPAVGAIAAAAACVAIGLGIWANSLSNSLDRERSAKDSYGRALQFLGGEAEVKHLVAGRGALLLSGRQAALVICGLAPAPSDKTYEAWVVEVKTPRPAGLFRASGDCAPVFLEREVPPGAFVAVTLERKGGSQTPTLPLLAQSAAA